MLGSFLLLCCLPRGLPAFSVQRGSLHARCFLAGAVLMGCRSLGSCLLGSCLLDRCLLGSCLLDSCLLDSCLLGRCLLGYRLLGHHLPRDFLAFGLDSGHLPERGLLLRSL